MDGSDTVGDLLITGMDSTVNGIVVDVSVTHPITGKGAAKQQAHHKTGHAASLVEGRKFARYNAVCRAAQYGFYPFVFETYGLMAPQTSALLRRLASMASQHVSVLELNPRESSQAIEGRFYNRFKRQLSLARIKTIADRFIGAARDERSRLHRPSKNIDAATLMMTLR